MILADLHSIKFSNLSSSAIQNEFLKIPGSNVYVYQHREYMQANHVKLSNIERACGEIQEAHIPVLYCDASTPSHDDDLLPFFYSNRELNQVYQIFSDNSDEPRKSVLTSCIENISHVEATGDYRTKDDERYYRDHNLYCYAEDTWTMRLYVAVSSRFYNDSVDYTANLRGDSANQAVLKRMPPGTPISTLLFHGSPDILIKYKAVAVANEGIGCIETKKNESMSYDSSSMIPQQTGQLVAYIHQQIVAKVISNAVAGKEATSMAGFGVYIMRSSGKCILFKVVLSEQPLLVSAKVYFGLNHKAAVLCRVLNDLASSHSNMD